MFVDLEFAQSPNGGRFGITFTPTTPGTYQFTCSATNVAGSDSVTLTLNVLTMNEVLDIINNIPLNESLSLDTAQELISVS